MYFRQVQEITPWRHSDGDKPLQKMPLEVTPPAECSNIFKAKIWKLALTRTPDPNRSTEVTSGEFSLGVISGRCIQEGGGFTPALRKSLVVVVVRDTEISQDNAATE